MLGRATSTPAVQSAFVATGVVVWIGAAAQAFVTMLSWLHFGV